MNTPGKHFWHKVDSERKAARQSLALISLLCFAGGSIVITSVDASPSKPPLQSQTSVREPKPAPQAAATPMADDTLIITMAPGADMDKAQELLDEVNGTVISKLHINADNYDILFVKPEPGKGDETVQKLFGKKDKDFRSIEHNCLRQHLQVPPNDPHYSAQWDLFDLNWPQAQATYINNQIVSPRITICDTGYEPYRTNNELVNVVQYDCTQATPVKETAHDVEGHGTNCSSIAAAQTDNGTLIAGVASLSTAHPVQVTMLRISKTSSGTASDTAILTALTWAANNQTNTPVSLSFGSSGGTPLWAATYIQTIAGSLNNVGNHLFEAAGNDGSDKSQYPEGNVTVVQATDQNDNLASFSTKLATPEAAPGVSIPAIWGYKRGAAYALVSGTSESTPMYAACAALLQSIVPSLNAVQATQILGQTAKTTSQGKKIPQLDAAIHQAL